ncbi:MAG: hypothetical protein WCC57_10405 [Paracoccaceae bacterium]
MRAVLGDFNFDHNLNRDEAGFTLRAGPPPPAPVPLNLINGTARADAVRGTAAADAIRGL